MTDPVLHVIAGPNGAGKSTFFARVLGSITHLPFINADEIAAARWPGHEVEHAYEAAAFAAAERQARIAACESSVTETVFSHESKADLLRQAELMAAWWASRTGRRGPRTTYGMPARTSPDRNYADLSR